MLLLWGDCRVGIESTVLDLTGETPMILRPGIVTPESIEAVLGKPVKLDPSLNAVPNPDLAPKAPGMKYKHYAPKAQMLVVEGRREKSKRRNSAASRPERKLRQ